jgi:hypothetical protein
MLVNCALGLKYILGFMILTISDGGKPILLFHFDKPEASEAKVRIFSCVVNVYVNTQNTRY